MADSNNILRPMPQKAWQITPASTDSSTPATPANELQDDPKQNTLPPSRTRSILNLTSSTLFGIYSPADGDGGREEISQGNTPWGTGAMTPQTPATPGRIFAEDRRSPVIGTFVRPQARRASSHQKPRLTNVLPRYALRSVILFGVGMAYGVLVTHLHENQELTPIKLEGIDRRSRGYLVSWGIAGLVLGSLLPWVDTLFEEVLEDEQGRSFESKAEAKDRDGENEVSPTPLDDSGLGADWNPAVRSIGVFVGIAYAIVSSTHYTRSTSIQLTPKQRRLPWQSTLQASLTLALVNPVLWYLMDRSKQGFIISTIVGIGGTAVLLGINPGLVPESSMPVGSSNISSNNATEVGGLISHEGVGVTVWIASVLFCSCVCFRNIGRRLAVGSLGEKKSFA